MDKVTRQDLALFLKSKLGFTLNDSYSFIDLFFRNITKALSQNKNVKIAKFGSFIITHKKIRIGRNPKTGETAFIMPRNTVKFKISEYFKKRIK